MMAASSLSRLSGPAVQISATSFTSAALMPGTSSESSVRDRGRTVWNPVMKASMRSAVISPIPERTSAPQASVSRGPSDVFRRRPAAFSSSMAYLPSRWTRYQLSRSHSAAPGTSDAARYLLSS